MLVKYIWIKSYIQISTLHYWMNVTNIVIEMCLFAQDFLPQHLS